MHTLAKPQNKIYTKIQFVLNPRKLVTMKINESTAWTIKV